MLTSPVFKTIALVSGGKDSFLSIIKCQEQGHQIVALANLYPPSTDQANGDLNSHMYQTAGHALIPFYEKALGIPLYRREISGKAHQLNREYDPSIGANNLATAGDETEDLTNLLRQVLEKHPDVNAVCSGAILSTYQRTRIESVCLRLGLKPLAFLWQMSFLDTGSKELSSEEKSSLMLDHFAEHELDARIVKVASGGLDESYLWESLLESSTRHRIKKTMRKFGGSVVGEGGEFETLVLSGPKCLFKGEIIVPEDALFIRQAQGGEAWIDIDSSKLQVKLWNSDVKEVMKRVSQIDVSPTGITHGQGQSELQRNLRGKQLLGTHEKLHHSRFPVPAETMLIHQTTGKRNELVWFNNIVGACDHPSASAGQLEDIIARMRELLMHEKLDPSHLAFVTILLRDMSDFERTNAIYGKLFTTPLPAARVTLAVGDRLPDGKDVMVHCAAYSGNRQHRQGLHVQSISHWAPANIGPYSQAIGLPVEGEDTRGKIVFVAGQIPLIPETMQPEEFNIREPQEAFKKQAELALRHATRIGLEMNLHWWGYAIVFVVSDDYMDGAQRASIAHAIWKETHTDLAEIEQDADEEQGGPDAWDLKYGGQGSYITSDDAKTRALPSVDALTGSSWRGEIPGFLAVEVEELPRQQAIEWQVLGFSGNKCQVQTEQGDDGSITTNSILLDRGGTKPSFAAGVSSGMNTGVSLQVTSATAYISPHIKSENQSSLAGCSIVPCHRVWGVDMRRELHEITAGIVTHQGFS